MDERQTSAVCPVQFMSGQSASGPKRALVLGNPLLKEIACAEGQYPAGRDRHLVPSLGIAPHPLGLVAKHKRPEARDLDVFAGSQRFGHQLQNAVDEIERFGVREASFAPNNLGQFGSRQCANLFRQAELRSLIR